MNEPVNLAPRTHNFAGQTWEERRQRLDADWQPLVDEKKRKVHGYANIDEVPAEMVGRVLKDRNSTLTLSDKPFGVRIIATREGVAFGAMPRTTWHATHEAAIAYARKALDQQGKRYAKKYGGAS